MRDIIINQIIVPILVALIGTILEAARRQIKTYLDSKKELIDKQKEALKQSMGIERYNHDVEIVKQAVHTVEQLAKEFNWTGAIKHTKVLEMVSGKTGLSEQEIINIIKATVLNVNKLK